jgi:hypothetical protein
VKRTADTEPRAVATGCYHSIHPTAGLLSIRLSWVELSIPSLSLDGVLLGDHHSSALRADKSTFRAKTNESQASKSDLLPEDRHRAHRFGVSCSVFMDINTWAIIRYRTESGSDRVKHSRCLLICLTH